VAIEAIKEQQTIQELAAKYELHPTQNNIWKREFLDNSEKVFAGEKKEEQDVSKEKELYSKIGELQIQVDFLKKSWGNEHGRETQAGFPIRKKDQRFGAV